jgi:spore maturation protein CgeB
MPPTAEQRLLIVGNPEAIHVGAHLLDGARELRLSVELCDTRGAYDGGWMRRRINWWVRGRRPSRLKEFGQQVLDACRRIRPTWLVTVGIAPVGRELLNEIGRLGVLRINYSTDDPWNRAHRARWFLDALPSYDRVFSTRRANLDDFRRAGCREVAYLPFAYSPRIHYPEPSVVVAGKGVGNHLPKRPGGCLAQMVPDPFSSDRCDVLFVGGADGDRVPYLAALAGAKMRLALYGGYWDRHRATRPFARGHAGPDEIRRASAVARVSLGLVRRANRDGHVMRTFEIAATSGCMLAEDTEEHREILGTEGETVLYFKTTSELVSKARVLLEDDDYRRRLVGALRQRIIGGANTYKDRLSTMLECA